VYVRRATRPNIHRIHCGWRVMARLLRFTHSVKRRRATLGSDPPRNSRARRVDATLRWEALAGEPFARLCPGFAVLGFRPIYGDRGWSLAAKASSARFLIPTRPMAARLAPAGGFLVGESGAHPTDVGTLCSWRRTAFR
jgi:hypothetical protein